MSQVEHSFQLLAAEQAVWSVLFVYQVMDRDLEPVRGEPVHVSIEGNGTFELARQVKEQDTKTDEDGQAAVIWLEEPIYKPRRDLEFTILASCEAENSEITMKWFMKGRGM